MPQAAVCGGSIRLIGAAAVADFYQVVVAKWEGLLGRKLGTGTRRLEGVASPGVRTRRRVRQWRPARCLSHAGP